MFQANEEKASLLRRSPKNREVSSCEIHVFVAVRRLVQLQMVFLLHFQAPPYFYRDLRLARVDRNIPHLHAMADECRRYNE